MATQTLSAIGTLKLGRGKRVPTKVTVTNPVGDPALLGSDATSSEQIVNYTALNDVDIDGTTVSITYTAIANSQEVDNIQVSGITQKAVTGSTIVAWGTDGIMPVTAKATAVV